MNQSLDVITAALLGAGIGSVYWAYTIITEDKPIFDSSDHIAGAAGGFISSLVMGAFALAGCVALINLVWREK